jgi:hypothetical protein
MKIALVIFMLIFILLLIIFSFQYKTIQTFDNNYCNYSSDEFINMNIEKNNIKAISDIFDNIYDIAVNINNKSDAKIILDNTDPNNIEIYNQALATYNASSLKNKLKLILSDKKIINNYYKNKLDFYNTENAKCI